MALPPGSRLGTHETIGLLGTGGMGEVYRALVQPFPATGAKYLARQGGHPYWSAKGDELILNIGPGSSVRIPFMTAPRVAFGQPEAFSRAGRTEGPPATSRRNADSMPDGEHIIASTRAAQGARLRRRRSKWCSIGLMR